MKQFISKYYLICFCCILLGTGCEKYVPIERENIGLDSDVSVKTFTPVLGRTTSYTDIFFKGSTTFPSNFKILNFRRRSGEPAPELETIIPVTVWKQAYTGQEKSLEEIEQKRGKENRQLFEIGKNSGEITMWAEARSNFLRTQPDSGYLFDMEVTNSGGRRYFQGLQLMPYKEVPFEPTNLNALTGMPANEFVLPSGVNLKGDSTNRELSAFDIKVYIRKSENSSDKKLTIRFLDKNDHFINPDNFSATDWANLVHGFNMVKTATGVTYDVAYPIPLAKLFTRYTSSDGSAAYLNFRFYRQTIGGQTRENYLRLFFRIFEPGNWEIVFKFSTDNPRFTND